MVRRYYDVIAAFLVQPEERAFALGVVVGHAHRHGRAHACEAVQHDPDQGAIAQAYQRARVDAVQQAPGLDRRQHRCLAGFNDVFGAAHRTGRVEGHDLADNQPIEQHADGRQVLLDGRRRVGLRQLLDVGGHQHRLNPVQRQAPDLAPVGEPVDGRQVGHARVRVTDVGGEEFPEPGFGFIGAGEQDRGGPVRYPAQRDVLDGDQLCVQLASPRVKYKRSITSFILPISSSRTFCRSGSI